MVEIEKKNLKIKWILQKNQKIEYYKWKPIKIVYEKCRKICKYRQQILPQYNVNVGLINFINHEQVEAQW